MIRVTIELLPWGCEARKQHLGTIEIANDGSGSRSVGHYRARLSRRGAPRSVWKEAKIKNFPRLRWTAYDLLYRVLREVVGERNENKRGKLVGICPSEPLDPQETKAVE